DVIFAQRLPALVEQLVIGGPQDTLDEKLIVQAERLMAYVISPDHRLMIVNNVGKSGGLGRTLKYVLRLRGEKTADIDQVIQEFVKHLIPPGEKAPPAKSLAAVLRLIKQSWLTLTQAEPMSLIRIFCQLPYRADGKTDSIAPTVMESYVTRLTHEKYATTYNKVVNSLRNMFQAKPDSPTLLNFMALVKWVSTDAAGK